MKNWKNNRPDDWKNPFLPNNSPLGFDVYKAYEAGADAMYEPAYKKGQRDLIERYKRENPGSYKKHQIYWDDLLEEME